VATIGEDRFGHPEEEEAKGRKFQVIDKRFLETEEPIPASEAPPPPVAATPAPAEEPREARTIKVDIGAPAMPEPEMVQEPAEDETGTEMPSGLNPDPLSISNGLLFMIEEMFTRTLIFMGLHPHPQTGLTVQKLDEAQRGIQVIELLINEVRRDIKSPEVDTQLTKMVAQLKATYVQLVTGGVAGGLGPR